MTAHTITIDDPRMAANLDFLMKISPLFTPQSVMCSLTKDMLETAARRHKRQILYDYKSGIVSEERYTELMGKPPSDDLRKEAHTIQAQEARVRYVIGEIDADEYESLIKEPPTPELKSKRVNMRAYLDNLTTFARQGAHMFSEREVEQMFWRTFGMGSMKEEFPSPLGKDYSA